MNSEILDEFVRLGLLANYKIVALDENGEEGQSKFRNSQRISLTFPSKTVNVNCDSAGDMEEKFANTLEKTIHLTSWCSGCLENTGIKIT